MDRLDDLSAWRIFCEIVRSKSLIAACERLDCDLSKVSRALKALEDRLGTQLLTRNGRHVRLTATGQIAYEKVLPLLAMHTEMLQTLQTDQSELAGPIHVAADPGLASSEITPALVDFQRQYPNIHFQLTELTEPLPEGFITDEGHFSDVVIGYGDKHAAPMPGVLQYEIGDMPFVPCASPLYLNRCGEPRTPEECRFHTGILIASTTRRPTMTLTDGYHTVPLHWKSTLSVHNWSAVKSALQLGAGMVPDLALYFFMPQFESGALVPILKGWHRPNETCFIFVREEAAHKHRVQVFVEWMVKRERQLFASIRERFPEYF